MKRYFLVLIPLFLLSCTTQSPKEEESEPAEPVTYEEVTAVCIWDKVSVREEPSSKGKWKTSISVGETLTYLGEQALDSAEDKTYYRVRLADETEGWSVSDFIVPDGKVGVFTEQNNLYKRPDLLTKTNNKFSMMDIVAIKTVQDDWLEVTGKRSEGKWIDTGWIKGGNISQKALDVAVAKFGKIALAEEDKEKQAESLKEILDNADFASSVFIAAIQEKYDELTSPVEVVIQEADSLSGTQEQ